MVLVRIVKGAYQYVVKAKEKLPRKQQNNPKGRGRGQTKSSKE